MRGCDGEGEIQNYSICGSREEVLIGDKDVEGDTG